MIEAQHDVRVDMTVGDLERLHEAICENRRQDAIDILNDMQTAIKLRGVDAQRNLFPNRTPAND